jgi:hypothetical protein
MSKRVKPSHSPVVNNKVREGKRLTVEEKWCDEKRERHGVAQGETRVRCDKRQGDIDTLTKFPRLKKSRGNFSKSSARYYLPIPSASTTSIPSGSTTPQPPQPQPIPAVQILGTLVEPVKSAVETAVVNPLLEALNDATSENAFAESVGIPPRRYETGPRSPLSRSPSLPPSPSRPGSSLPRRFHPRM